jgi:hypothetical protein
MSKISFSVSFTNGYRTVLEDSALPVKEDMFNVSCMLSLLRLSIYLRETSLERKTTTTKLTS